MILGIGVSVFGYAVFYWGLHHFPKIDGGKRYSLFTLLGVPEAWGLAKGGQIGLSAGTGQLTYTAGDQSQTPENQTTPNGLTGNSGWQQAVLQSLGAPNSANNVHKMNAWNACEGNLQGHSGLGINNPFNITADSYQAATHGDTAVNSAGVQSFSTLSAGIQGTVAKLQEPFAAGIKNNLINDGSFGDFANAVGSSGWGTSGGCIAGA